MRSMFIASANSLFQIHLYSAVVLVASVKVGGTRISDGDRQSVLQTSQRALPVGQRPG